VPTIEGDGDMAWMLVFFVVGLSAGNSTVTPVVIPMASEKLCNQAMSKLKDVYQQAQAVHNGVTGECIQVK